MHTWLVCVSVQGADMSRQMLFLHSRNTICEQRLKTLLLLYLMYFHLIKMYNRHMNFETVSVVLTVCIYVNVLMCLYVSQRQT